jgi:hypothetical protein
LQAIYRPLCREPLEAPEDLKALEGLEGLEGLEDLAAPEEEDLPPTVSAIPTGGNPPAANPDNRMMGSLPQLFNGNCRLARSFLDQITNYFQANAQVPGLNSLIQKVSIALTLF